MQRKSAVATGRNALDAARTVLATAREKQLSFLAASIAYYMLVSLFPLGLLALVVATMLGGDPFAERVVVTLGAVLTDAAAAVVQDALVDSGGRSGATLLGLAVLLWSGLRVFRGLDVAFSLVYGHGRRDSFANQLRDALVALAGIGVAVVAVVAVTALVARSGVEVAGLLAPVALVATLTAAFLPLFVIFPDAGVSVRDALPGTLTAAVGWALLGSVFTVYAALAGSADLYGVIGGVLLLVTWFYDASLLLLLGAVVNATLTGERGRDRHLQQVAGRTNLSMTDDDGEGETPPPGDPDEPVEPASEEELQRVREELREFREDVDDRTLHREAIEDDLRSYVRSEMRGGHARGWGPYVVLLYGTLMTLGAFYYITNGLAAIAAMFVIWLSTLGLYVVMVMVGTGLNLAELPARAIGRVRNR